MASLLGVMRIEAQEFEGRHTLDNGIVMSLYDDATATVSDDKNCTDVVAVYNYHRSRQRFGHHQGWYADVNSDGVVNASDVTNIYNKILGN